MKNLFIELLKDSKHKKMNHLYAWIEPLFYINGNVIELYHYEEDEETAYTRLRIYTSRYSYSISAKIKPNKKTYMGCISQCRLSDPGEDWKRGRDLPDGSFSASTWNRILNSIVRNELEQISTYITKEKSASFETFMNNLGGGINICSASIS